MKIVDQQEKFHYVSDLSGKPAEDTVVPFTAWVAGTLKGTMHPEWDKWQHPMYSFSVDIDLSKDELLDVMNYLATKYPDSEIIKRFIYHRDNYHKE